MKKINILLLFLVMVYHVEALECGIRSIVDSDMKKAITSCLTKNMTTKDMYDFPSSQSEDNGTSTLEHKQETNKIDKNNSSLSQEMRNRKARSTADMKFNRQVSEMTTTSQPEIETEATNIESSPQEDNCIIQCILSRLELTNQIGFPEQEEITNLLTKKAKGREFIDFLRDSTENCFHKIKEDSSNDPCNFSLELVRCLADEGKSNCGDWPVGDVSLFD